MIQQINRIDLFNPLLILYACATAARLDRGRLGWTQRGGNETQERHNAMFCFVFVYLVQVIQYNFRLGMIIINCKMEEM
jgi:hypothetical protein